MRPGSREAAAAAESALKRQADAYWGAECEPKRFVPRGFVECPACDGTGQWDAELCGRCDGNGSAFFCRCCGEGNQRGYDCCSDEFPEAADLRETGR